MGIPKDHSLLAAYPRGDSNGYGRNLAEKRFSVLLKDLKFTNVLDVGSGACFLKTWLQKSDISANYEAVDIRPEALALCDCTTYSATPRTGAYDLICLLGTVTYNLNDDVLKNKKTLKTLLKAAKKVAKEVGFPILIKAAAGGGGKGMRIVEEESQFEEMLN